MTIFVLLPQKNSDFLVERSHFQALQALVQAREKANRHFAGNNGIWPPSTINISKIHPIVVEIFYWLNFVPKRVLLAFGPSMATNFLFSKNRQK